MIYQNTETENTQNKFSDAISELKLGKLLRKSNITKNCGVPAYEVFQFLLLLVFQGKNLFRFLNSKHKDQAVSKNTYYRFLNDPSYNWKKFLLLLAAKRYVVTIKTYANDNYYSSVKESRNFITICAATERRRKGD